MARPEKTAAVSEFRERVENSQIAVATKFIGIKAGKATELRKKLRDEGVQLKVYKNTLVQRALDEMGLTDASKFLDGPVAWAFCDDPVAPAKILKEFNKETPLVDMNGGILEGDIIEKAQLEALASLPSKDVLLGQVVGTIAMPLRNFVGVMSAVPRNFVNVLEQIRKQKEEQEAA